MQDIWRGKTPVRTKAEEQEKWGAPSDGSGSLTPVTGEWEGRSMRWKEPWPAAVLRKHQLGQQRVQEPKWPIRVPVFHRKGQELVPPPRSVTD